MGNYSGWGANRGRRYPKCVDKGGPECVADQNSFGLHFCRSLRVWSSFGLVVHEYLAIRSSLRDVQKVLRSEMVVRKIGTHPIYCRAPLRKGMCPYLAFC